MTKKKIAVVGAGFSGLTLASNLKNNFEIHLFEKSRGLGGRLSCKHTDFGKFNHGAPYFTARRKDFQKYLEPYLEAHLIEQWKPKVLGVRKNGNFYKRKWFEKHYKGAGEANAFLTEIASKLDIKFHTQVSKILKNKKYDLYTPDQIHLGEFDMVISTAPPQQSFEMFKDHWSLDTSDIQFESQFTLLVSIKESSFPTYEHLSFDQESPCGILLEQPSKFAKDGHRNFVLHAKRDWSEINLEQSPERITNTLLQELQDKINFPLKDIVFSHIHRWRYVQNQIDTEQYFFTNKGENLFIAGDMFRKGNLESAYLSCTKLLDFLRL